MLESRPSRHTGKAGSIINGSHSSHTPAHDWESGRRNSRKGSPPLALVQCLARPPLERERLPTRPGPHFRRRCLPYPCPRASARESRHAMQLLQPRVPPKDAQPAPCAPIRALSSLGQAVGGQVTQTTPSAKHVDATIGISSKQLWCASTRRPRNVRAQEAAEPRHRACPSRGAQLA